MAIWSEPAVVVRLPDGRQLRLGNPGTSPVRAGVVPGNWTITGRSRRWRVAIEAECPVEQAFVLPVPLVEQRRLTPESSRHRPAR